MSLSLPSVRLICPGRMVDGVTDDPQVLFEDSEGQTPASCWTSCNRTPSWESWSLAQLELAADRGPLRINPIIFAEFAASYRSIETAELALADFGTHLEEIPREALFLAGKAYRQYRQRRGTRTGVLADFFIGAHAAVREIPVLTRDTARIRTYFPAVTLISPVES